MNLEEAKSIAQIALPVLVAIVIPYFRKINTQLQELNKQMALSSASLEYLLKEFERMRERQHKMENVVQKVSLIQERCGSCNGD